MQPAGGDGPGCGGCGGDPADHDDEARTPAQAALDLARRQLSDAERAVRDEQARHRELARPAWQLARDLHTKIARKERALATRLARMDEVAERRRELEAESDELRADVQARTHEIDALRAELARRQAPGGAPGAPGASWTDAMPKDALQHPAVTSIARQAEEAMRRALEMAEAVSLGGGGGGDQPAPAGCATGGMGEGGCAGQYGVPEPVTPTRAPAVRLAPAEIPSPGGGATPRGRDHARSGRRGTSPASGRHCGRHAESSGGSRTPRSRPADDDEAGALARAAAQCRKLSDMGFVARRQPASARSDPYVRPDCCEPGAGGQEAGPPLRG